MELSTEGMGSLEKSVGQFGDAHVSAFDRGGNIYVAEALNWQVPKFTPA